MKATMQMAGDLAAHAVLSISSGEVLIPIFSTHEPSLMTRMMHLKPATARADLDAQLANNPAGARGGAYALDTRITLSGKKIDALLLEVQGYAEPFRCTIALPYRRDERKFHLEQPVVL